MTTAIRAIVGLAGFLLVVAIVWDAFEAIVLPRRVTRSLRPTRWFYRSTWTVWRSIAMRIPVAGDRRSLRRLSRLRRLYEPYVMELGQRLLLPVPTWSPPASMVDNWRSSAWETPTSVARAPLASDGAWERRSRVK